MAPRYDQVKLAAGTERPTSAAWDSPIVDTGDYPAGWLEFLIANAGGTNNLACNIDILSGGYNDATKLKQMYLSTSEIYVDDVKLSDGAITGFTHGGITNPGRIAIASTLAGSTRVRIPMINWPRYLMMRVGSVTGGSAGEYWEAIWFGRSSS